MHIDTHICIQIHIFIHIHRYICMILQCTHAHLYVYMSAGTPAAPSAMDLLPGIRYGEYNIQHKYTHIYIYTHMYTN